jgi:hypothetical protein
MVAKTDVSLVTPAFWPLNLQSLGIISEELLATAGAQVAFGAGRQTNAFARRWRHGQLVRQ